MAGGFFSFVQAKKDEIVSLLAQERNQQPTKGDINKVAARMWTKLSDVEKLQWTGKKQMIRSRYH
eukprot:m.66238 g.66238  ORF g.66238 m.66238 type:complete len:65 (-) comp11790_c0_seq4:1294-1488(-)